MMTPHSDNGLSIIVNIKFLRLLPVSILLLMSITACEKDFQAVRIGSNQWIGYEPVYLARELQYFNRNDIHLVELPSTTDVMQYIRNGSLEGGMLTLDEVITLISEEVPLSIILIMDFSNGADAVISQSSIKNIAQLKGKRLGVEVSALGAVMLEELLKTGKLNREDIEIIPLTVDSQEKKFKEGGVDAVITFDPTRSRLIAAGGNNIFDTSQIQGRIIDVLAVRRDALEQHSKQLQILVDAYFSARKYMQKNPKSAMKIMAPRLSISADALQKSFEGILLPDKETNRQWLSSGNAQLIHNASQLSELMFQNSLIKQVPILQDVSEDKFLMDR